MSHPITHVKNANQHPGQIVLKTMQKHHTSKQKHQEDAHKMQEKHEQQGVQAHAIKQVAEIISEGIKVEKDLLRNLPDPFPAADGQLEDPVDDIEGAKEEEYIEGDAEACDEAIKGKKWHTQKMMTCDLVDVAQNASLQQHPGNTTSVISHHS
ncbi:hypothetical protein SCLCIDRAFT_24599 [Scleroderma citrinum Foug A]|uniref:Uncharacterized protein n=1 Tax=Scleroderma citrinum Foug A TaxID=1036808 RepID=A0A0C3ADN0_9AGAM|nr:hypothetical protein SCLCIDRAFT_24599 [Scleroderma citrinum Foug A]